MNKCLTRSSHARGGIHEWRQGLKAEVYIHLPHGVCICVCDICVCLCAYVCMCIQRQEANEVNRLSGF